MRKALGWAIYIGHAREASQWLYKEDTISLIL